MKNDYDDYVDFVTKNTTRKDTSTVLNNEKTVISKGAKLKALRSTILLVFQLIKDYVAGRYHASWSRVLPLVGAIVYLISPLDAIPDPIPVLGLTDDAAVLTAVFYRFAEEIENYRQWRNGQE